MEIDFKRININISETLLNFSLEEFQELTSDNAFNSYGWLLATEQDTILDIEPIYFSAHYSGKLIGMFCCYRIDKHKVFRSPDNHLFGRSKSIFKFIGLSFQPVLFCGHMKGYGQSLLVSNLLTEDEKNQLVDLLIQAIEKRADQDGLNVLFSKILESELSLQNNLRKRGYLKTYNIPITLMNIHWNSMEEYKKFIKKNVSKNARNNIKKETNSLKRKKIDIQEIHDLGEDIQTIFDLLKLNYMKHNPGNFPYKKTFFTTLQEFLKERLIYLKATKGNNIIGASIFIRAKNNAIFPFVGVNHVLSQKEGVYFNLTFYKAQEIAFKNDLKQIWYGATNYNSKIRRGCLLSHTYDYFKGRNPIVRFSSPLWFSIHKMIMGIKYKKFRAHFIST
jgi:predicted N-acyltransferase